MAAVGKVLADIERVIENPGAYSEEERRHICADFAQDHQRLTNEMGNFANGPDGDYVREWNAIRNPWSQIRGHIVDGYFIADPARAAAKIAGPRREVLDAIAAFPIRFEDVNCEARSPFKAYCRIKKLCETACRRLVWVDRYLDGSTLKLYFERVPEHVDITIVTWPASSFPSGRSNRGYHQFMATSKLFAGERPDTYTLRENQVIHPRRLLCDDQLYKLDNSARGAAADGEFQIHRDPTGITALNTELAGGQELFGRTVKPHPG